MNNPVVHPKSPHLLHENALWVNGALWVAGIDEAGRGALAGPVVAAAVILPQLSNLSKALWGVRDSKKMTPKQRQTWAEIIKNLAVSFGIGMAAPGEIDDLGILPATKVAAARGIDTLAINPDSLLIDYIKLPDVPIFQVSITRGDMYSLSIAAASVLAKTTRDEILVELDDQYPEYKFARNKGYGTKSHLEALKEFGPSPVHRMSFAPIRSDINLI